MHFPQPASFLKVELQEAVLVEGLQQLVHIERIASSLVMQQSR